MHNIMQDISTVPDHRFNPSNRGSSVMRIEGHILFEAEFEMFFRPAEIECVGQRSGHLAWPLQCDRSTQSETELGLDS